MISVRVASHIIEGDRLMKIAIPKERRADEARVAASPDTVKKYVGMGFEVVVESGAGEGASIADASFAEVGATIAVDEAAIGGTPFSREHLGVSLRVPARRVLAWRSEDGVAQAPPVSPVKTEEVVETLRLVPYAAAKLRVTAFPSVRS